MDWTPGEIKKLVKKFGGVAVMAEIMRVTPKTVDSLMYGVKKPSTGAGIALLNLLKILCAEASQKELERLIDILRSENRKTAIRSRARIKNP